MKLELSVTEINELINTVHQPKGLFEVIRGDVRQAVGDCLSELMGVELSQFLGRSPYERNPAIQEEVNYRNGTYERTLTLKGIGEIKVQVPRDRQGDFQTKVMPRSQQYEQSLVEDVSLMFLSGVSTRTLSMLSKRLLGRNISAGEISQVNQQMKEAVETWRQRDLSAESFKYMYLDGVNFRMRISKKIRLTPVLVAIGVLDNGHKCVLGLQAGDKESASCWREFFKDLKLRGLKSDHVQLGIMDGLSGLETVFRDEFLNAVVQRCQVHVARNVLAKVNKSKKKAVADDLRSIFYASTRIKAMEFYKIFVEKWEKDFPSAVRSLSQSLESCLTFFRFPQEDWISLRTTNLIERLNKEFRRRTRPMEIMAGEESCYALLTFICLKMELHWRTSPVGKVKKNLPFFKNFS